MLAAPEAPANCPACPRLAAYRRDNAASHPTWFNGAVPSFGPENARLLIVGLAPGLQGANRTGRPFTGDYAGDLLYATLLAYGFATGEYAARPDDGLQLRDCMITNAIRCAPPQNKPTPQEALTCRPYLLARIGALPNLKIMLALGRIAHDNVLSAHELKRSRFPFSHGAIHELGNGVALIDSYHCSRYNTNTRRLTEAMFHQVFETIQSRLARS